MIESQTQSSCLYSLSMKQLKYKSELCTRDPFCFLQRFPMFDGKGGCLWHMWLVCNYKPVAARRGGVVRASVWKMPRDPAEYQHCQRGELLFLHPDPSSSHSHERSGQACASETFTACQLMAEVIPRASAWRQRALRWFNDPNAKGRWAGSEWKSRTKPLHQQETASSLYQLA